MEPSVYKPENKAVNVGKAERAFSLAGGVGMLLLALARPSVRRVPLALAGAYMLFRGATGNCMVYRILNINRAKEDPGAIRVERSQTINRPISEVYAYWHNLENLPAFMKHLESVETIDSKRSHWVAKGPLNTKIEWDAEVVQELPNELISWRSLPGSLVEHEGLVRFKTAPSGRGTEVYIQMDYRAPGGSAGTAIAKLLGEEPDVQIKDDLRHFKQVMEAGEIPTTEGQPSGRESVYEKVNQSLRERI